MSEPMNPFMLYTDAIVSRQRIEAILRDCFYSEKAKVHVLMAAYDAKIVDAIHRSQILDDFFLARHIQVLVSEYAIVPDLASWAVLYWMEKYGEEILGKTVDVLVNPPIETILRNTAVNGAYVSTPAVKETSSISIKEMKEGDKLPKSLFEVHMDGFRSNGIQRFSISMRREDVLGEVTLLTSGEYEGHTKGNRLLLIVMVFNSNNEMIAADFSNGITEDIDGIMTYSFNIYVPGFEEVGKVDVRLIPDPAWIWG